MAVAPMRGRYFVRNKAFNALFRATDAVLGVVARLRPKDQVRPVRRILIANGAHLGDVVLATAVLPVLRAALPGVRIGMLVGSWSAGIVRGHPLVDWVHTADHWRASRAAQSRLAKFRVWRRTSRHALREIREVDYDCAIDLYFYVPTLIPLLRRAGIPQRIGWTSGGFGPLLTDALDLHGLADRSMVEYHLDLVRRIPGIGPVDATLARPSIARRPVDVCALAGEGEYVVVHMGSGSPLKDWPVASWRRLVQELLGDGHRIVFTGSGAREREQVAAMLPQAPGAVDLSDRLNWAEFVEVVAGARLLVGVDSVSSHVAAAVGTPVVVASHGMNNLALWRPVGPAVQVLRHPMPCAPCYRKTGCATIDCLRALPPERVAQAARDALGRATGSP